MLAKEKKTQTLIRLSQATNECYLRHDYLSSLTFKPRFLKAIFKKKALDPTIPISTKSEFPSLVSPERREV